MEDGLWPEAEYRLDEAYDDAEFGRRIAELRQELNQPLDDLLRGFGEYAGTTSFVLLYPGVLRRERRLAGLPARDRGDDPRDRPGDAPRRLPAQAAHPPARGGRSADLVHVGPPPLPFPRRAGRRDRRALRRTARPRGASVHAPWRSRLRLLGRSGGDLAPAELAAEQLLQPPVRLGEAGLEALARLRIHRRVVPVEDPRISVEPMGRCAEEVEDAGVRLLRMLRELLVREDEQLLAGEVLVPALELIRVDDPGRRT